MRKWRRNLILASSTYKNMKIFLSFISIYFAAALIFNAQAQSSKSIRKTASTMADSGPRTALVIGNANYSSAPLKNPVNDARDIANSLRKLGFDVTLLQDAGQNKMRRAINNFGRTLRDGGVGLFYFSGHGIQVDGKNFLIPVGASIESEDDVEIDSVAANRVLAKMNTARNSLNIVIMDACRNNPFARSFRSASRGLASMDAPKGTFIAYATASDNVASDGTGGNSPYTSALVQQLKKPGLKLEDVFKKVSAEVQIKTNGKQVPWVGSNFTGDFYFIPPTATSGDADLQYERQKLAEEKLLAAERQKLAEQKEADLEYERQENQRQKLAADRKEADLRYERQQLVEEKRKVAAERRRIAAEQSRKKTATAPKTQTDIFSNSERMRVRFDSSLVGSHEGNFGTWENTPKTLNLMTISMIFKNNFAAGISTINLAGTTTQKITQYVTYDYKNWGVSGSFLNGYYVFEETNPNTYWIDEMPLSFTLGTSYPLSLEMKYWGGSKDNEANMGSQLISIGATVADDFELILNRNAYNFSGNSGNVVFYLTTYSLGIGYFF
jgi:hypothetical protein